MREEFHQFLLEWYRRTRRDLPWRRTRDPYAIWLSEIMLQQTRVTTAIPYYTRFLERFPTVSALAAADDDSLLSAWSGLGYYSRVRNLRRAAQDMRGSFPTTYDGIRALPGVGDYTAAAVASIAFGLPHAAVDGNVLRVLARVSGDDGDIARSAARKRIAEVANRLLDREHPGAFNEAMMELGATVCLPRDPQCLLCPVQSLCQAKAAGTQCDLPVKGRKSETVHATRKVYITERNGALLLWQRPVDAPKLAGFWELPEPEHLTRVACGKPVGTFRHSITNHAYTFEVHQVRKIEIRAEFTHAWLTEDERKQRPVSTTVRKALQVYDRCKNVVKSPVG